MMAMDYILDGGLTCRCAGLAAHAWCALIISQQNERRQFLTAVILASDLACGYDHRRQTRRMSIRSSGPHSSWCRFTWGDDLMADPKLASTDHPIHALLVRRWSPYAFLSRPVPEDVLCSLFEAARWAPSSYNEQPWAYIVATSNQAEAFERVLSCLVEGNRVWAKAAPVLALGCARLSFARNGQPNGAAFHDLGQASCSLTLEATARGLFVHQMAGILPDRAREIYHMPEGVQPLTGLAIGYLDDPGVLPENLRNRDLARARESLCLNSCSVMHGDKLPRTRVKVASPIGPPAEA